MEWWFIVGARYQLSGGHRIGAYVAFAFMAISLAVPFAVFGVLVSRLLSLARERPWWFALTTGASLTLIQWLPSVAGFPPIGILGYTQGGHLLGKWAAVGGVLLVTFWIGWLAAVCVCAVRMRCTVQVLLLATIPFAGASLAGWLVRIPVVGAATVHVALVQGGTAATSPDSERESVYASLLQKVPQTDLVVLPENVFNSRIDHWKNSLRTLVRQTAGRTGADIILGARAPAVDQKNGMVRESVSAFALHFARPFHENAVPVVQRYDKHELIPGAEFTPRWMVALLALQGRDDPYANAYVGQEPNGLLHSRGLPIGISLCYELYFGDNLRQGAAEAAFLINIANSHWFAHGPLIHQSVQVAQIRAVETGRNLVRLDNVGTSVMIDATGEVLQQLPPGIPATMLVSVQGRTGRTPYVWIGEMPWLVVWASVLLIAGFRARRTLPASVGGNSACPGAQQRQDAHCTAVDLRA